MRRANLLDDLISTFARSVSGLPQSLAGAASLDGGLRRPQCWLEASVEASAALRHRRMRGRIGSA